MGKHFAIIFIIILITTTAIASSRTLPTGNNGKATVHLQNDLGDGIHLITHCKSKDDGLGIRDLSNGEYRQWSFHPSFFLRSTRLFWSTLKWNNIQGKIDVYDAKRDMAGCVKCSWSIKQDGAYSYNQKKRTWELLYAWEI